MKSIVKSIVLFIVVLLIILFSVSNVHHIPMHFLTGNLLQIRLIYLLLFSYILGVLSAAYFFVLLALRRRSLRKSSVNEDFSAEDFPLS